MKKGEKLSVQQLSLDDILSKKHFKQHNKSLFSFTVRGGDMKPETGRPYRLDFYTFLFFEQGNLKLRLNLIDYEAEENTILLLHPNTTFQFENIGSGAVYHGILFRQDFLAEAGINKKYLNTLEFLSSHHTPLLKIEPAETGRLCNLFTVLDKQSGADTSYAFRTEIVHHLFSAFMYELASVYTHHQTKTIRLTRNEEIAIGFLNLLPHHFKKERSVKWYAEHLFVTPKYLSETVKEATGKTASYYIDEMVILEAKMLLDDASLSVAQIAEQLHFTDQFVFSKFFKRMTEITPTEYRRRR